MDNMIFLGIDDIKRDIIDIKIKTNPSKVEIIDEKQIPSNFKIEKREINIDKKAILKHAKETGEMVSGVKILQGKSLSYKWKRKENHDYKCRCDKGIQAKNKTLHENPGEVVAENPDFIKNGDAAIVKIKPVQPMVIEKQKDIPQMSRFAVRDSGATVAAGMCIDLVEKK